MAVRLGPAALHHDRGVGPKGRLPFAVFEPNDLTTWLKVKGMIESFLYGLWERGAPGRASAAAAYFVNVGLGKTMTSQDILEGRMIVEIGIAAVRPAEFVVLRFLTSCRRPRPWH